MIPLDPAISTFLRASKPPPKRLAPPPAPTQAYKPLPEDTTQKIVDFYAGKAVPIAWDVSGTGYGGFAPVSDDLVRYTPAVRDTMSDMLRNYGKGDSLDKTVPALGTLIHEALHTRGAGSDYDPSTGLYGWDDEWQARQLSYGLVADALQRFFGVKNNTPLGQKYYNASRGYSYTDPVKNPFGGPETPEEIAQYGERTRPTSNPYGWLFPWATPPPSG